MSRQEILSSPEYWIAKAQLGLYDRAESFMETNDLNRTQLAEHLGVSKGYVSQLLNGDYDHKLSKFIALSVAFGFVPKIEFVPIDEVLSEDMHEYRLPESRNDVRYILGNVSKDVKNGMMTDYESFAHDYKNECGMIRFRMIGIDIDQFAILTEKSPSEGVAYAVEFAFKGASNANRIACVFTVEFTHSGRPMIKLSVSCEFEIHPDDWKDRIKDKILSVSKDELGYFANQTVGVARGIMFCKTENTEFRNFILPPINLSEILDEDLTIDLSK